MKNEMKLEHIGHVVKTSVSKYRDLQIAPRLHQYAVPLSRTLNLHCFSHHSCKMSTRREHPSERCLFSAMSSPGEKALKTKNKT